MINDKQFLISSRSWDKKGWNRCKLNNGMYLYWQNELRISMSDDKSIILMGHCWSTREIGADPINDLLALDQNSLLDKVYEVEKYWCGRYVLIVNNILFSDTSGLLPIYISEEGISSSVNILLQLQNTKPVKPILYGGMMPDFYPGTISGYLGIKRLLCSQVYNIENASIVTRPLLPFEKLDLSNDECLEQFVRYFDISLKNMSRHFHGETLSIALTGGRDSRVLLALMKNSGVNFDAFTLQHPTISKGDAEIPLILSEKTKIKYTYVERSKTSYSQTLLNDYKEHTANRVIDKDGMFYAHNQYQALVKDRPVVILRSGIWACTTNYYQMHTKSKFTCMEDILKYFKILKINNVFKDEFSSWLEDVKKDNKNTNLSLDNRMYWEFRNGNWLGDIEQSFDMMDGITSIQPLNSRVLLYYLISMDEDYKKNKNHEEIIVKKYCPEICDIPYDYKVTASKVEKLHNKFRSGIKKWIWLSKNYGPIKAMQYFI